MVNKIILTLTCLIFLSTLSNSQDFGKVHQLIIEGIDAVFDVDFNTAVAKFKEAKSIAPGDLRGPYFESSVYFWRAMLTKNKGDYETFLSLSDKTVEHCEKVVDVNENDLDARLYLGWTLTMRAFGIGYLGDDYLKAASEIKEGSENLKFIIERNPNYYDAYLGLGVYNYLLSFIPRRLQWLTSILGFTGDRDEGKKMLALASEKGVYTSSEAKFYMVLLLWREEDYPQAENYMSKLSGKYPKSPAVWMLNGLLLTQQDKMNEAIQAYEKALEFNKGKDSEIIFRTAYGALGSAYFRINNFEMSSEYGKKYMSFTTKDDNINNRLHSIGVSLELLGRRSEALGYYNQAKTDIREGNDWEKFWLRKLRLRQSNPVSQIDSLLIIADNNRATGKLTEALDDYNRLNSTFYASSNDDIKAQINQGSAQVYIKKKDYNKAIELFTKNVSLNPSEEKWLVPEAYFQIGRCYLRLGDRKKAEEFFDKANDVDYDYDFKDSMDGKIKNELSKK